MDKVKTRADFDMLYNPDGTCHQWDCGKPGVVLAYDAFTPESACWFCDWHWSDQDEDLDILEIIEDLRPEPDDRIIADAQRIIRQDFEDRPAAEIIQRLVVDYDLGDQPYTQSFGNTTFLDALLQITGGDYACHEVEPGVYEHTFTPPHSHDIVYQGHIPITIVRCPGYRLTRKAIAEARAAVKARHARKRLRRQHRAMYRRRKRGLA